MIYTMKRLFFILLLLPILSMAQRDWANLEIGVTELAPGLHRLFVGNSVAVLVSHGDDGIFMVDAAYEQSTDRLMEEIRKLSDQPIRYLVNTHIHSDHTGGNKVFGKDATIIAHASVKEYLLKEQKRGETVMPAFPEYALPDKLVEREMELEFNNEKIKIIHFPGGHTLGDLVVYFPAAKVVMMADLLFAGFFPYVDIGNGGNPFKYLENVTKIIESYPQDATIVGGHGPVFSMSELRQWHNTLSETITAMRSAKAEGMTEEQMKEKRILKEWEQMGSFFITENRWIETIYPFL
jgi:cyclase